MRLGLGLGLGESRVRLQAPERDGLEGPRFLARGERGHGGGNIARHKLRGEEAYFFFLRAAGFLDGALRFFFAKSCDTSTSSSSSSET